MADEKINPSSEFLFTQSVIDAITHPRVMFQRIQKRDGTIVDFDKSKIGKAIFSAAEAVGGKDRDMAENLSDRVILYLARTHDDGLLNVEQIQDAVEKVLIENGHARTVKAYILYRDQRARIRKVQTGKVQLTSKFPVISPSPEVRVQTSDDELVDWNKERIIGALVREAQLEKEIALVIASEVEQQIIYSKMQVVTVGLIRELVNAKLIEYGLIQEHRLHARLGLPVYDMEQLFFPDTIFPPNEPSSPTSLDSTIAKDIYRQYALTRVFSNDVVTAHARGQIHLHNLDSITRLVSGLVPLANLIKNGLLLPTSQTYRKPAIEFSELITQLIQLGAAWQNYFTESVDWLAFNLHLSTFQINQQELDKEIRRFLTELNGLGNSVIHRIHFVFPNQTNPVIHDIFSSFLTEYAKGDDIGRNYSNILPVIHLSNELVGDDQIFHKIAELINEKRKIEIHFDHQVKLDSSYTIHKVTLNIVEAAAKAKDNLTDFLTQLNEPIKLAIQAHQQKNQFITHLLSTGKNSILSFLSESFGNSIQEKNYISRFALGITGLEQAVELVSLSPNMTLEKKMEFAVTVLEKIIALVKQESWKSGLNVSLEPTSEKSITHRLSKLTVGEGIHGNWTPGAEFAKVDSLSLYEKLYSCFGDRGIISIKPTLPVDRFLKEILDCTEIPGLIFLP